MRCSREPDRQRCDACGGVRLPEIALVANRIDLSDTAFRSDDQVRVEVRVERRGADQELIAGVDVDTFDRSGSGSDVKVVSDQVAPEPVIPDRTRRNDCDRARAG